MLRVWNQTKYFRYGVRIVIPQVEEPGHFYWTGLSRYDPLLRWFTNAAYEYVVPMDPLPESGIFSGSFDNDGSISVFSTLPRSRKVKHMLSYDDQHYGSFFDNIQGFWSLFQGGDYTISPPSRMFSEHFVRHETFEGRGVAGVIDLPYTEVDIDDVRHLLDIPSVTRVFSNRRNRVYIDGSTVIYDPPGYLGDACDVTPFFDYLSKHGNDSTVIIDGASFHTVITNFSYAYDNGLRFSYDAVTHEESPFYPDPFDYAYHFSYDGEPFGVLSDLTGPDDFGPSGRYIGIGHFGAYLRAEFSSSNHPYMNGVVEDTAGNTYGRIIGIPSSTSSSDDVDGITEDIMRGRLISLAQPLWRAFEDNLPDVTALSRDTATIALNRLASLAYEPTFGKIGAINPLKVSSDALSAKTADAALKDAQRNSLKDILRGGGGAGLVKYRTIFSDCLQMIGSLEVLGALRSVPSRLYTASAHFDYGVKLCGKDCTIYVRSKAYLILSPFRLLQILIGKQAVILINDLLALYYSSQPLGELLLVLLPLRKIGDYLSNRMFFDLPIYFVHSYKLEYQLSKADLDYTGISSIAGSPVSITYFWRDVSRHLPTMRFSNLAPFYSTGDIGDAIWTLLQQFVGVLSSGI